MKQLMNQKQQLPEAIELVADAVFRAGALRVSTTEPFVLTSGKLSPLYFDCRRLISDPAAMNLIAALFQSHLHRTGVRPGAIAGGESAGIPFADRLATLLGLPLLYVRKESKAHGTGSLVEGALESGTRVVLVEDLITDGISKMRFVDGLRTAGAEIDQVLVVLDREQGGAGALAKFNVSLYSLCTARLAIEYGARSGRLSATQSSSALKYLSDPEAWRAP